MNELELYSNYTTRRRTTFDNSTPEQLSFVLGDDYRITLHTNRDNGAGGTVENFPKVRTLKASVGDTNLPPVGGQFSLTRGGLTLLQFEETTLLNFNVTAAGLMTAWNALGPLYETIAEAIDGADSTWLIRFENDTIGQEVPIVVSQNKLRPQAFVRVRPYVEGTVQWHEVRLMRAALAFTSEVARVLPPPPSVKRVRTGGPRVVGVSADTNEVQSIFYPVNFVGTYYLKFDYRTTKVLGLSDDADAVALALNRMYGDGQTRFLVTNPELGSVYIEFVGPLAEQTFDLMQVVVNTYQPGPLVFDLNFDRATSAAALRALATGTNSLEAPFEVELTVVDDDQDPTDLTIPGRTFTLFQDAKVTLSRENIWAEMDSLVEIEWARPPQPTKYDKISSDQVLVGHLHFEMAFGVTDQLHYVFDHDLNTAAGLVGVRINDDVGQVLGQGTAYGAGMQLNSITIDLVDFPTATDSLVLIFVAIENTPSFAPHHHEINEVNGLAALLETYGSQISTILDRLGYTVNTSSDVNTNSGMDLTIPGKADAFYGKFPSKQTGGAPVLPTRVGALPPAIHKAGDAIIMDLRTPPDLATAKGKVYQHSNAVPAFLTGLRSHSSPEVSHNEYVGCDGRGWYKVRRKATTNSWYPTDMEVQLFNVPINDDMLTPGHVLDLNFNQAFQLLAANAACQCVLRVDVGVPTVEPDPDPTGENIKSIQWNENPIVFRTIQLSDILIDGKFGINLRRAIDNTFAAVGRTYGTARPSDTGIPSGPNFYVRATILEFDVVDDVDDPRGCLYYALSSGLLTIR